jgi:putative salt-induced outer membrane protein YdiY
VQHLTHPCNLTGKLFMRKLFALILPLVFSSVVSFAQQPAKSVYAELGGPGIASINYDMRFLKKENGPGFRVGIGGFSVRNDYYDGSRDRVSLLTIPIGVNWLFGNDGRHYFEAGAGATIVRIKDSYDADNNNDDDIFRGSFGHLTFGYRMQPANSGFTFRAAITPVFGRGTFIPYYAGISFGYKF